MWFSPSFMLFTISIFLSIFMVTSSPSYLMSWVGLELNTLAFIPFIIKEKYKLTSEAALKYFLTQTLASILFILAALLMGGYLNTFFVTLLIVSLSIKLGAAPFHAWLPSVAAPLSWWSLYVLLTIQKINPLLIIAGLAETSFLLLIAMASLVVGAIQGLAQIHTRLLITFSSISHVGWMLSSLMLTSQLAFTYFALYTLLLLPVVIILQDSNNTHINQLGSINLDLAPRAFLFLNLLSLGGLPPFLGFLPKWIILQEMVNHSQYAAVCLMIFMSLITLYFYLRISFSAFIMSHLKWSFSMEKSSTASNISTSLSLLGLSLSFLW